MEKIRKKPRREKWPVRSTRYDPEKDKLLDALAQRLATGTGNVKFAQQRGRIVEFALDELLRQHGLLSTPGVIDDRPRFEGYRTG